MRFAFVVLFATLTAVNLAAQSQEPPKSTLATLPQPKDTSKRPELTPGPRPLTKQEESFVRDNRARYIAQATNDIDTFTKYLADEYFGYEGLTGELRTRETWRHELSEAAAAKESTISDPRMPKMTDPFVLRNNETLVIAGNTAVFSNNAGAVDHVPIRITSVWIYRDGRWQMLFSSGTPLKADHKTPR